MERLWFSTTKHITHKKRLIVVVIVVVRKNNNNKLYSYSTLQQRLKQQNTSPKSDIKTSILNQ